MATPPDSWVFGWLSRRLCGKGPAIWTPMRGVRRGEVQGEGRSRESNLGMSSPPPRKAAISPEDRGLSYLAQLIRQKPAAALAGPAPGKACSGREPHAAVCPQGQGHRGWVIDLSPKFIY